MKRKALAILLSLCLTVGLLPAMPAAGADTYKTTFTFNTKNSTDSTEKYQYTFETNENEINLPKDVEPFGITSSGSSEFLYKIGSGGTLGKFTADTTKITTAEQDVYFYKAAADTTPILTVHIVDTTVTGGDGLENSSFASAKSGKITLIGDTTIGDGCLTVGAGQKITLDMNGSTLSSSNANYTIHVCGENSNNTATLEIINSSSYFGATITNTSAAPVTINADKFSTVNIGTKEAGADNKHGLVNGLTVIHGMETQNQAIANIYGGTFDGSVSAPSGSAAGKISISGGVFSSELDDSYVADGYAAIRVTSLDNPTSDSTSAAAAWAVVKQYTVTFHSNGGSEVEAQSVTSGETATMPTPAPTKAHSKFEGWYRNQTFITEYNFNTSVTENLDLYAKWSETPYTITVIFDAHGGSGTMENRSFISTGTLTLSNNGYSREGYRFTGWNTDADGKGTAYQNGAVINGAGLDEEVTLYAQWERIVHTVTFVLNGGTLNRNMLDGGTLDAAKGIYSIGIFEGDTVEKPPVDPAKEGYKFEGWITEDDEAYLFRKTDTVKRDFTLYAKWSGKEYEVTIENSDNGSISSGSKTKFGFGETVSLTVTPETNDYELTVANITVKGKNSGTPVTTTPSESGYTFVMPAEDVTVTAKFTIKKYTVTFNANGGTGTMAEQTITAGGTLTLNPNAFSRKGYTFDGWNTASDGSGTKYGDKASIKPDSDLTLYAQWTAHKYTVTFHANGGSGSMDNQEFFYGTSQPLSPNAFTIAGTGRAFAGWATTSGATTAVYTDGQSVSDLTDVDNGKVDLYAVWGAGHCTVTFYLDNSTTGDQPSISSQQVVYGETARRPTPDPEKDGYAFGGWYDESGEQYLFNIPVTSDISLKAKWESNSYTVTFHSNDGSDFVAKQTIAYNKAENLMANRFIRTGYTFLYWHTDPEDDDTKGTRYEDRRSVALTEDLDLYAQWGPTIYSISLGDQPEHGTFSTDLQTAITGTTITITGEPVDNGYTLGNVTVTTVQDDGKSGISIAVSGTGNTRTFTMPAENVTVTAEFTEKTYTITFDSAGGSTVEPITALPGTPITAPANPTRAGYTFDDWDKTIPDTMPAEDMTITAQWTANTYNVAFEMNGGTPAANTARSQKLAHNARVTRPADPSKTGYTFDGWYSDSALTSAYDFNAPVTQSFTLYAKWTPNSYTVSFFANGGNGTMAKQTFFYGTEQPLNINEYTRTGYSFTGWNTAANGSGTAYSDGTTVQNLTAANGREINLYAQWTAGGSPYKVEHYRQNIDNDEYTLHTTQTLSGTTDATVTAIANTYAGFTENRNYTGRVASGKVIAVPDVTDDKTLVLKLYYDRNSYQVTLKAGEGVASVSGAGTYRYGKAVTLSAAPAAGYHDPVWTVDTADFVGAISGGTLTVPAGNITLTATATADGYTEYRVEHYLQNTKTGVYELQSEDTQSLTGATGAEVTATPLSYDDYIFDGTVAGTVLSGTVAGDGSLTLKLYYVHRPFTVSFDTGEGSAVSAVSVASRGRLAVPAAPTRLGYAFGGWYSDSALTRAYDFSAPVTDSFTLYAKWTPNTYYISFKANGGTNTMETQAIAYGTEKPLNANTFTRAGYAFIGWNTAADGSGTTYLDRQSVGNLTSARNGVVNLYAQWATGGYKVEHWQQNINGDEYTLFVTQNLPGDAGTAVTAKANEYPGFTENTSHPERVTSGTVTGDGSLTLRLYYDRNTYAVTLNAGEGIVSVSGAGTYRYGKTVTLSAVLEDGYRSAVWTVNTAGFADALQDGVLTVPAGDITLTATASEDVAAYRVEHYLRSTAGGTYVLQSGDTQYLTGATGTVVTAEPLSYYGYEFNSAAPGTVRSGTIAEDGSLVLRLYYVRRSATIYFNTNGGSAVSAITAVPGTKITAPTAPTRMGYTFSGWYPALPSTMPDTDTTVTAQWTPKTYAITYVLNGGSLGAGAAAVHTYGTATLLPFPSRAGYSFSGWYTSPSYSGASLGTLSATGWNSDITLYANWTNAVYSYSIAVGGSGTGGELSLSRRSANAGDSVSVTGTPDRGWRLGSVSVRGNASQSSLTTSGSGNTRTFTMPAENVTVSATFERISYTVTLPSGVNGGRVIASRTGANYGDTVTLTVTPDANYTIGSVSVDGASVGGGANGVYTFTMPASNVTVSVRFNYNAPSGSTSSSTNNNTGSGTNNNPGTNTHNNTGNNTNNNSGDNAARNTGSDIGGNSGNNAGSNPWSYPGGSSVANTDGSSTTTYVNGDGSVTRTTRYMDGSIEVSTTRSAANPDGSGTETRINTHTDAYGVTTVRTVFTNTAADGSTGTTVVDGSGQMLSANVNISNAAYASAMAGGGAALAPITVSAVGREYAAGSVPVTLNLPLRSGEVPADVPVSEMLRVEIPVAGSGEGVIAMTRGWDGELRPVRESRVGSVILPVSESCEVYIVDNTKTFSDVPTGYWGADYITFVTAREIFNGYGDSFYPETEMNRAMVAQTLYNYDRNSRAGIEYGFSDVFWGDWWRDAAAWAGASGIIRGSDGAFRPTDSVTRQDLVTMLYRYAAFAGYDVSRRAELDGFRDAGEIAPYALEAMQWAYAMGILRGYEDGTIRPAVASTRTVVAVMLRNFVTYVN